MLKIAKDSGLTDIVSEGEKPYINDTTGEQQDEPTGASPNPNYNPLTSSHPIAGSVETVQVYVFNDDATKRYETVSAQSVDTTDTDESSWIELSEDDVTYVSSLSLGNIDDTSGHLVYVRVTTPSVADTQNKTDISLQVEGTEFAV